MLKQLLSADSPWTASISSQGTGGGGQTQQQHTATITTTEKAQESRRVVQRCPILPIGVSTCSAKHLSNGLIKERGESWACVIIQVWLRGFSFAIYLLINLSPHYWDWILLHLRVWYFKWTSALLGQLCIILTPQLYTTKSNRVCLH